MHLSSVICFPEDGRNMYEVIVYITLFNIIVFTLLVLLLYRSNARTMDHIKSIIR
jgi:hypothetical protein